MSSRRSNRPSRQSRNNRDPSGAPVTLRCKLPFTHTTTAASANALITLGFDGESTIGSIELHDISDIMASYRDLYRYFRIKRCSMEVRTGPSFTEPEGGVLLSWMPRELSAAPTSYNNTETMFSVPVILHPEGNQLGNKLTLEVSRLGGMTDWLTTSVLADTGIQEYFTNYGSLWLLTNSNFTVSQSVLCLLYLDMEFKTLHDPDVLRSNIKKEISEKVENAHTPHPTNSQHPPCGSSCCHNLTLV